MQGQVTDNVNVTGGTSFNTTICQLEFDIPLDIGPPIFLYYQLTDFFQNHRRYVKSFDANQLLGQNGNPASSCSPLDITTDPLDRNKTLYYYPCGLIANSMFNDTIMTPRWVVDDPKNPQNYNMTSVGIAWSSDSKLYGNNTYPIDQILPPPNWAIRWDNTSGYAEDNPPPDLATYEQFQVWMRTAGLPTFNKLALRNDNETMRRGRYLSV